jgi:tol-pal system protein YbgF
MNRGTGWWMVALVVVLGGCSSFSGSQPDPGLQRDLEQMKQRILDLQEKAAMTEVELERLRQEVARLEARPQTRDSGREAVVEVPVVVVEPPATGPSWQESVAREEQILEESDLPLEQEMTPTQLPPSEAMQGGEEEPIPPAATTATEPGALEAVVPAAQALYDRGYTLYHQGRYLDAEASFQRFLQAYPRTDLSDNAQFWIGESRYARGDLSGALSAFREALQLYPEGNKVADALVKAGDCLAGMGDRDGARQSYEEVVRRFPGSAAAVMAAERMSGLQ